MRRITITLWVALGIAVAHLGWTWLQRREASGRMMRASAAARERSNAAVDRGSGVKVLAFYATAAEIRDGDDEIVCYGVENAKSVRMEPPVEALRPALTRCFRVEPHRDTRYTIVAVGEDGRQATESFSVRVKPALPWISFFAVSHKEIVRGDAVTLCYGVQHAEAVELQPIGWQLAPIAKNCARFYPKVTHNYTLVAFGAEGATDRQKFTVGVR